MCTGHIVSIDNLRRRPFYHLYSDGDEKDFDDAEFKYALDLYMAVQAGEYTPNGDDDPLFHSGYSLPPLQNMHMPLSLIQSTNMPLPSLVIEEEAASISENSDDSEDEVQHGTYY